MGRSAWRGRGGDTGGRDGDVPKTGGGCDRDVLAGQVTMRWVRGFVSASASVRA